ncbi:ATP-binding protein [Streptomyces sp. NPDC093982]|uniref:ATP-binding protein n=1 Tax=Streptomyces sp. NPDC093982 TaxID=3155077 RepID=UPI003437ED8D
MSSIAPEEIQKVPLSTVGQEFYAGIALSFEYLSTERGGEPAIRDLMRVGECRHIGSVELQRWGLEQYLDTALLLMSELVTNAIQHGTGSQVDVRLTCTSSQVKIEVRGGPTKVLRAKTPSPLEEHGRGLLLVDTLADAWGVDAASWVWCTIETVSPRSRPPDADSHQSSPFAGTPTRDMAEPPNWSTPWPGTEAHVEQ